MPIDPAISGLPQAATLTGDEVWPIYQNGQRVATTLRAACITKAAFVGAPILVGLPGAGPITGAGIAAIYQNGHRKISTVAAITGTRVAFAGEPQTVSLRGALTLTGAELVPMYQAGQLVLATVDQIAAFAGAGAPTVTLSASIAKAEGNKGANLYTYTVARSSTVGAVSVPWSFTPGNTSADDFTGGVYPAGGSVALADGQASGTFSVSVNGDTVVEGDETFTVYISTPNGYVAGASTSATGTILNDDVASAFPAADLFAFNDSPASGNAIIRDRPGWAMDTSGFGYQNQQVVTGGNFVTLDAAGGGSRGLTGQDVGRTDGGQVFGTLAGSTGYDLVFNRVDEQNYMYLDITAAKTRVRIFKVLAGVTTTVADSASTLTLASGDIVGVKYGWSAGNCTITFWRNGVQTALNGNSSWTVAASGLLQPSGYVGLFAGGTYSAYSAGMNSASALPRLTLNKPHRIYQRDKVTAQGTVPVSGIAKGVTAVQFRLLQNDAPVSGWDFGAKTISGFTVDAATGVWSGTISGIPQGNNYQIQVRDSVDPAAGSLSRKFDVGVIIDHRGQSLATQIYGDSGAISPARADFVNTLNAWFPQSGAPLTDQRFDPLNFESEWDWSGFVTGGYTGLANRTFTGFAAGLRASKPSLAFSWFSGGYGSQKLVNFLSSSAAVPYQAGAGRTLWNNEAAMLAYFGDCEVLIWDQGQEDAGRTYNLNSFSASDAANYKTNFINYIAAKRALLNRTAAQLPVITVPIGRMYPAGGTIGNYASDAAYDLFFRTQVELCSLVANCSMAAQQSDLTLASTSTSEPHLSGTDPMGYPEKACRLGYDVGRVLGAATDRRGALPVSMAASGNTLAITFNANTATALTCAQAIATNFAFWTDNTFATPMAPTAMSIGALTGGQFVVTFTFGSATATGNVVSSGKGGAYSVGGSYPDTVNALKATQADGRSVITWPVSATAPGYLAAA